MAKNTDLKLEIEKREKLMTELGELNPQLFSLVNSAQFLNIAKLNALLEKLVALSKEIQEGFKNLSAPEYNNALLKLAKQMEGLAVHLRRAQNEQTPIVTN